MIKKRLQLFSMMISVMMLLSFIACSEGSDTEEETATVATSSTATATATQTSTTITAETTLGSVEINPFEEFYEITWLFGFCDVYEEGAYDELLIEERYNIDLKCWHISYYDNEGLAMMLAAGDIPDFSNPAYCGKTPQQLYEGGFTRTVPIDMHKQYFPYYYKLMEKHAPRSLECNNLPGTDEYYGISHIRSTYKTFYNSPLFRLDWLENIGYDIPEEELKPVVLTDDKLGKFNGQLFMTSFMFEHEELNDIFRAFTEDDPDGNGEDDTYAAVIWPHTWKNVWVDLYWGQFGVMSSDATYLYKDELTGSVVPWYAYSGYKEYVKWATDMYQKGYMRTLTEGNWRDVQYATWMTGKVGYFNADRQYIARPDFPEWSDAQPPQSLWLNGFEDATFVVMPVLKGPGESWGNKRYNNDAFQTGIIATTVVGEQVSDGKLARMLTIWNDRYTKTDDPWIQEVFYGKEHVHFKWSGEPWNSSMIKTDTALIPPKYRRGGFWGGSFNDEVDLFTHESNRQILMLHLEDKWMEKYGLNPYKQINLMDMGAELYEGYQQKWAEVSPQINAVINDFANRAWRGDIANIDTEWEFYIDQLYAVGLEDIIKDFFENDEFRVYTPPAVFD